MGGVFARIRDGLTDRTATVTKLNALKVSIIPTEAVASGEIGSQTYFSQYCEDSGGSLDMVVDGSVTPVDFIIEAEEKSDLYINQIVVFLADSKITFNKFGALTALTNGFQMFITQGGVDTYIVPNATIVSDLVRFAQGDYSEVTAYDGNNDLIIFRYNLEAFKLQRNATDTLTCRIRDNMAGIVEFNAIAFGYKQVAEE